MLSVLWICTPSLLARACSRAVLPRKQRKDEAQRRVEAGFSGLREELLARFHPHKNRNKRAKQDQELPASTHRHWVYSPLKDASWGRVRTVTTQTLWVLDLHPLPMCQVWPCH